MAKKKERVEVVESEQVTPKKKVNKRKIFTIIGAGLLSLAVVVTTYWAVIEYVLKDYENMGYMTFQYSLSDTDATHIPEVTITGIYEEKNYPSNFRVPTKLLGYKVTGIGDYAFAGLERLKTVSLPNTVTSIGTGAFSNCDNLTSVKLESKYLTYVGDNIFEDSPKWEGNSQSGIVMFGSLLYKYNGTMREGTEIKPSEKRVAGEDENTHLYIGDEVTLIASGAFANQTGLKSVELPKRFTSVSDSLVKNCPNLESFTAEGVVTVGDEAFSGCTKLTEFDFEKVKSYGSDSFSGTGISEVVINDSVTYLNDRLFKDCSNLSVVVLPNGINRIGEGTFMNCSNLKSIESGTKIDGTSYVNNLENINYIGTSSFENTGLVSFNVPKNVTSINSRAFKDCTDLVTFTLYEVAPLTGDREVDVYGKSAYSGLQTIEDQAFQNTTSLTQFVIPSFKGDYIERDVDGNGDPVLVTKTNVTVNTLYKIGDSAFENSGLTSITLPASLGQVQRNSFKDCAKLAEVKFQDPTNSVTTGIYNGGVVGDSARTTDIRASAFENTPLLSTISLPNSLTAIQSAVFKNSGISSITLSNNPAFNTLGENLFSGCKNLTQIDIPTNINTIKANAFEYSGLTSITIGEEVSKMEARVFYGCESLTVINLNFTESKYNDYLDLGNRGWSRLWNVVGVENGENVIFSNIVFLK